MNELGKKIGKTPKAISHKAQRLNLSRPWQKYNFTERKYTKKEIEERYYNKNKKRIYDRKFERRKKLKQEAVDLLGGKCSKCGYKKCIAALEFHHPGKDKEVNVSNLFKDESRQKILKEVRRCILWCANCHRELHSKGA